MPANYNTDAAGSLVSMTPTAPLAINTKYEVRTNTNLKSENGATFESLRSSFTTGTGGTPSSGFSFSRSSVGGLTAPTSVTRGPDGKLYVATALGEIRRYTLGSNGVPTGSPQVLKPVGDRTIIGMVFDRAATADNIVLWIAHNTLGYQNMPNYTGKVSVLTGPNLAARDVITGLPRSVKDHFTNSIRWGPDGRLYISQGANTSYGAPTPGWGNRQEDPLSAAILAADVDVFTPTFTVTPASGYNPNASGAKLKRFVTGVRNAYDMVWHPNGNLYVPVNESADGSAPAGPNNPAITNLPAGKDFLARVPEPAAATTGTRTRRSATTCSTAATPPPAVDPWEQPQYPVGVQPEPGWQRPIADLGVHRSANGIDVYHHRAFNSGLYDHMLVAEFSNGDDILDIALNSSGGVASVKRLTGGFNNPLDLFVSHQYGNIYVLEYGNADTGEGGALVTLRPAG